MQILDFGVSASLVIGNYYSLRNEHEKAVRYYQRAVQLHPSYGAAWTLMGHEYLEMKNSHAAIEAYRRGIGMSCILMSINKISGRCLV